jgi:hypothetical protein
MIKKPAAFVLSVLAVLIFATPAVSMAQDSPPPLAEMWLVTPKADHGTDFYKALAEHMAFRSENGDPRKWEAYSPMLGDDLKRLAIRYCCFTWADQDAYREWSDQAEAIDAHFNDNVAPHVEKWAHYFETMDWENSHWSEESGPFKMFAVTEFNVKPGHAGEFNAAREKMSQIALNQGWATNEHLWIWASTIGGKPQESIIIPHKNFASMERDEDSFPSFLAKHMGSEAASALLKQFANATWSSNYQTWQHREKYSMSGDD